MSRTPDLANRERLFSAVLQYVVEHGVAGLSLRPLSAAVGVSPRLLLYHFRTKEALVAQVLKRAGDAQRTVVAQLKSKHAGSISGCREIWQMISAPAALSAMKLFFEVYGLALRDRDRYSAFLQNVVTPWLTFIGDPLVEAGWTRLHADAYATLILSAFRGFLLDLCATGDRPRIDAAVELWLHTLSAAGADKELAS